MWNVIPENLMYMDRVKRRNCDIGLLPRLCGKQTADVILCGGEMLHGRRMLYGGKILHDGETLRMPARRCVCREDAAYAGKTLRMSGRYYCMERRCRHDGKLLFYAGKIPLCAKILIQSLTECIVT